MNIAIRKLAMLEKDMIAREEQARFEGYASCPIDQDLKNRVTFVMDKVRLAELY